MRPLISGGSASASEPRERAATATPRGGAPAKPRSQRTVRENPRAVKVRRMARGAEDGFSSSLLPGLKSSEDAARLVDELAFATVRLTIMAAEPFGVWAQIAGAEPAVDGSALDHEARTALALQTALSGDRGVNDPAAVAVITDACNAWVARAGSQEAAFTGESFWTAERRFERLFERLAFQGFTRDARFEFLVLLGRLDVYEMRAGSLHLAGENEATWAAKRAMGIADSLLLERRTAEFAQACQAPLDALDLALHNWGAGVRLGGGIEPDTPGDEQVLSAGLSALGL